MHVKRIHPLHRLPHMIHTRRNDQKLIRDGSSHGGNNHTKQCKVDKDTVEPKVQRGGNESVTPKHNAVRKTRDGQEGYLYCDECWIISRPVILRLFAVVRHLVHFLYLRGDQEGFHLVQCGLDVHLRQVDQALEVDSRSHIGAAIAVVPHGHR